MIFVVVLEHYREELFRPMLHVSLQQQQSVQSSFPNVGALGIQNDVGRPVGNWRRGWIFPVLHFPWRHGQRMVACGRWCRKAHRVFAHHQWMVTAMAFVEREQLAIFEAWCFANNQNTDVIGLNSSHPCHPRANARARETLSKLMNGLCSLKEIY